MLLLRGQGEDIERWWYWLDGFNASKTVTKYNFILSFHQPTFYSIYLSAYIMPILRHSLASLAVTGPPAPQLQSILREPNSDICNVEFCGM